MLKKAFNVTDAAVINYQKKFYLDKEKSKSKSEQMREIKEKQFATIQKIKELDKTLSDLNFDVNIAFKNIYLGVTGDRDDPFVSS
jgi:hypothetical protein